MNLVLRGELEREEDGRWIAEIPDKPGVIVYGSTRSEAINKCKALLYRVLAEEAEEAAQAKDGTGRTEQNADVHLDLAFNA